MSAPDPAGAGGTAVRTLERRQLECGSSLIVIRNSGLPIFSAQVLIDAGHMVETPETDGSMHLAGRLLLSGGAGDSSGREIYERLESAGVRSNTLGSGLRFESSLRHSPLVYDTLADAMRAPRFDPDRFALEHGRLRAELLAAQGNLRLLARNELGRAVYGTGHPLGRPARGTPEVLETLDRDRVVEMHARHVGPERLIFAVTGDVQADDVARELDRRLGDWRHPVPPRQTFADVPGDIPGQQVFVERDKEKLHVYMGHLGIRRDDPDFYPLLVMDQILGYGSGFTSRLARHVRDQLGLAYSVFATIAETAGREPGMLLIYAGTFPDKLEALTSAVRHEMATLLADGVTDAEVDAARTYLRGSFLFDTETNNQLADLAVTVQLHDLPLEFPQFHLDALAGVTPADVERAARAHLHPDRLHTIAAGRKLS